MDPIAAPAQKLSDSVEHRAFGRLGQPRQEIKIFECGGRLHVFAQLRARSMRSRDLENTSVLHELKLQTSLLEIFDN